MDWPDALAPPEILDGLGGWYEDFWELTTERQLGFGIGPIPANVIDMHTKGWTYEDADMFKSCIRSMDAVYMSFANKTEGDPPPASAKDAFRGATAGKRNTKGGGG